MRAAAVVGLAASLLAVGAATPAAADGLHIFQNDPQFTWDNGCAVKYTVPDDMPAAYVTAIEEGLAAVTAQMSMTLTRVPATDRSPAVIRYSINPNLPSGVAGQGSTAGTVALAPLDKLPNFGNDQVNTNVRTNLIAHESLHVFGLTHDMDETDPNGPNEIMYPMLPLTPLSFGNGDLTGMAFVKDKNRCGTANPVIAPPVPIASVDSYMTAFTAKRTARGVTFTWKKRNATGVTGTVVVTITASRNNETVGSCTSARTSCSIRLPRGTTHTGSSAAYLRTTGGPVLLTYPTHFTIAP